MSRGKPVNPFAAWFNLAMLAAESQQVIGLRMVKLALGGPRADAEARRMVSEKVAAATEATGRLMWGATPDSVVRSYRTKVRANARRLRKS
ncbi:MAG: hypothetical protein ACRCVA_11730 [Phreatobacter sp.]